LKKHQGASSIWIAALMAACSQTKPMENDAERQLWEEIFRQNAAWEQRVGQPIEIEGVAINLKLGAKAGGLWIDGLESWTQDLAGKKVKVSGQLIRRDDLPVFTSNHAEPVRSGMPVPPGVDLDLARRRYLIAKPKWTQVP
jgi:hypothetical protein